MGGLIAPVSDLAPEDQEIIFNFFRDKIESAQEPLLRQLVYTSEPLTTVPAGFRKAMTEPGFLEVGFCEDYADDGSPFYSLIYFDLSPLQLTLDPQTLGSALDNPENEQAPPAHDPWSEDEPPF